MNSTISNSLIDPKVRTVIDRVWSLQARLNPAAGNALLADLAQRATPYTHREIVEIFVPGSFACPPETGRSLYTLVRAIRPKVVLEFGTGHGFSALHLAAALRDNGEGHFYGSEMDPVKVLAARANLDEAGLADWADVLAGDASETLGAIANVDLLYLDGWVDHYLDVLQAVECHFTIGAFIQADDVNLDWSSSRQGTRDYLSYVGDPANGYNSVTFSDYQGFVQSCFVGRP